MKRLLLSLAIVALGVLAPAVQAASSAGCQNGGFTVLGLSGDQDTVVAPGLVPNTFLVRGRYIELTVDAATFGVLNWTFTGAPSELDLTGGRRTVVFARKMPDHRGLALTSGVSVKMTKEALVLQREGAGLTMKIQVKDCASGGLFQMEVERDDQAATVFTHVLADGIFYYDNPNVRDRLGERLPCSGVLPDGTLVSCNGANADGTVTVTARVNFGNDLAAKFVGRDSPQVATRLIGSCPNTIPNPTHPGSVNHCGGITRWSVASGGRMGQVMGEDATEIAPAASVCVENCIAQNQVNGRAVVVGNPFPVPTNVRLQPRLDGQTALQMTSAISRLAHGAAGSFDIPLPLTGEPGVESRASGGNHSVIFTFTNNVLSGNASVTAGTVATMAAPTFAANTLTLNLAGVSDQQKVSITLSNVTDSFGQLLPPQTVSMNVLLGDVNGNKSVNASDITQTRGAAGAAVTAANFRADVTPSGSINSSDAAVVKSRSGAFLP